MYLDELDSRQERVEQLGRAANRLRRHSLISTDKAGSGHPTSSMSCAEIVSILFFEQMRMDPEEPDNIHNDHFVLSKGHAAPVLWSAFYEAGMIGKGELDSLREMDSAQEGHPTPRNRWVEVATGSLGQGLSMGLGMAWSARRLVWPARWPRNAPPRRCRHRSADDPRRAGRPLHRGAV